MIIKLESDLKTYLRNILIGAFGDHPVINSVCIAIIGVFAYVSLGWFGFVICVGVTVLLFISLCAASFLPYRNKNGKISYLYELKEDSLKMVQGSSRSKHTHTTHIMKESVRRIWKRKNVIYIKHKWLTYSLPFDENINAYMTELQNHGWPVNKKWRFGEILSSTLFYVLIGIGVSYLLFPPTPSQQEGQVVSPPAANVTPSDVAAEVNAKRQKNELSVLVLDDKLMTTAQHACSDMALYKYSDIKNPKTGKYGYDYIYEYYPESEVGEVMLASINQEAKRIVESWVNNPQTRDMVFGRSYTKLGVAVCEYTVDHQYDKNIVLHLAS
jgi:uncharacterized protein YkwD